jgi:hypothetical protein
MSSELDLINARSIVEWRIQQHWERGLVTAFGFALQEVARIFSEGTGVEGADVLKIKAGQHYHIQVKSGSNNQWIRAMHYILMLIYNRREPKEHTQLTDIVANAVQDRKRREEVSIMGRTIAQALIEEGMEIGVEKGIIQTKQEDLIELIHFRFRDVRPEINDKIRSIQNADRLTALFRCTLGANSIE